PGYETYPGPHLVRRDRNYEIYFVILSESEESG
ncbi:unnamed protein product, partial [marine sediment metagenome]